MVFRFLVTDWQRSAWTVSEKIVRRKINWIIEEMKNHLWKIHFTFVINLRVSAWQWMNPFHEELALNDARFSSRRHVVITNFSFHLLRISGIEYSFVAQYTKNNSASFPRAQPTSRPFKEYRRRRLRFLLPDRNIRMIISMDPHPPVQRYTKQIPA